MYETVEPAVSPQRAQFASSVSRQKSTASTVYVNGRFLTQRQTGVQRYAYETLHALDEVLSSGKVRTSASFCLLTPVGAQVPKLRAIETRQVGPFGGHLWEQVTLAWAARDGLLWSFCPTGPVLTKQQAVTMHDAVIRVVPEAFTWKFRAVHSMALPLLVRRTAQLMTVSEFSRSELTRHFGARRSSVKVSGEGWQHAARTAPDPRILDEHQLVRGRYVLAVGSITPHKNFAVLERSLAHLANIDYQIVIAGVVDEKVFGALPAAALKSIKLVGFVTDAELRALYENAGVFVYPSLYEGFGLPPLEAMACGCPVLASRAAAIPEVCRDGAAYFDPHDDRQLAALVHEVMSSPEKRDELIARGQAQLVRHSWEASAHAHLAAIHSALKKAEKPSIARTRFFALGQQLVAVDAIPGL